MAIALAKRAGSRGPRRGHGEGNDAAGGRGFGIPLAAQRLLEHPGGRRRRLRRVPQRDVDAGSSAGSVMDREAFHVEPAARLAGQYA